MQNVWAISCLCEAAHPVLGAASSAFVGPASVKRGRRAAWCGKGLGSGTMQRLWVEFHTQERRVKLSETVPRHWSHYAKDNSLVCVDHAQLLRSLGWGCGMPAWEPGPPGALVLAQRPAGLLAVWWPARPRKPLYQWESFLMEHELREVRAQESVLCLYL